MAKKPASTLMNTIAEKNQLQQRAAECLRHFPRHQALHIVTSWFSVEQLRDFLSINEE